MEPKNFMTPKKLINQDPSVLASKAGSLFPKEKHWGYKIIF